MGQGRFVWVNGAIHDTTAPVLTAFDRGFNFADAIYDTLLVRDGAPVFFEEHLRRLNDSAAFLSIPQRHGAEELRGAIADLLLRNSLLSGAVRVRLTLSRGASERPMWELDVDEPTLVITASPAGPMPTQPLHLGLLPWRRDAEDVMWRHKTVNLLSRAVPRAQLRESSFSDALALNTQDVVCEATTSNVFALLDGTLVTPPVECGLLPGIIRAKVIEWMREESKPAREEPFTMQQLAAAEGLWVTNSIVGLRPAATAGWITITHSPLASGLQALIEERLNAAPSR